jgi:hypothetical protein
MDKLCKAKSRTKKVAVIEQIGSTVANATAAVPGATAAATDASDITAIFTDPGSTLMNWTIAGASSFATYLATLFMGYITNNPRDLPPGVLAHEARLITQLGISDKAIINGLSRKISKINIRDDRKDDDDAYYESEKYDTKIRVGRPTAFDKYRFSVKFTHHFIDKTGYYLIGFIESFHPGYKKPPKKEDLPIAVMFNLFTDTAYIIPHTETLFSNIRRLYSFNTVRKTIKELYEDTTTTYGDNVREYIRNNYEKSSPPGSPSSRTSSTGSPSSRTSSTPSSPNSRTSLLTLLRQRRTPDRGDDDNRV